MALAPHAALAASTDPLPAPLAPYQVVDRARAERAEVLAARARAHASAQRPAIVGALDDPMIMGAVDNLPISMVGVDVSLAVQQTFPLSSVLSHRRRAATADIDRVRAETSRVALDVELEALAAYYMLGERRAVARILDEQIVVVGELVTLTRAHYAAGQGIQADVLRLENEVARLAAERAALDSEIRAAESMLNTALAREPAAVVPQLTWRLDPGAPAPLEALVRTAISTRPELAGIRAERARAEAEIDAAHSLYAPMALVRAGPNYMMATGVGVMVMVGISVPLWRGKLDAGVEEATAMSASARAELAAAERAITGDIATARELVLAQRTRYLALHGDIVPRADRVVASSLGSFASGQAQMLPVLEAARDLRDVRMAEAMAAARLGASWARLLRATGDRGVARNL